MVQYSSGSDPTPQTIGILTMAQADQSLHYFEMIAEAVPNWDAMSTVQSVRIPTGLRTVTLNEAVITADKSTLGSGSPSAMMDMIRAVWRIILVTGTCNQRQGIPR